MRGVVEQMPPAECQQIADNSCIGYCQACTSRSATLTVDVSNAFKLEHEVGFKSVVMGNLNVGTKSFNFLTKLGPLHEIISMSCF